MNQSTTNIEQSAPKRQAPGRVVHYPLRDIISINRLQEFLKKSPGLTLGDLNRAQEQAAERMGELAYV